MAAPRDADGHQRGTVDQLPAFAHPLVAGIEKDIRRSIERSLAPDGQTGVQLFGSTTDLRRRNRDLRPEQHGNRGQTPISRIIATRTLLQTIPTKCDRGSIQRPG